MLALDFLHSGPDPAPRKSAWTRPDDLSEGNEGIRDGPLDTSIAELRIATFTYVNACSSSYRVRYSIAERRMDTRMDYITQGSLQDREDPHGHDHYVSTCNHIQGRTQHNGAPHGHVHASAHDFFIRRLFQISSRDLSYRARSSAAELHTDTLTYTST